METGYWEQNTHPISIHTSAWGSRLRHLQGIREENFFGILGEEVTSSHDPYIAMYDEWLGWLHNEGFRQTWQQAWDKWRKIGEDRQLLPKRTGRYRKAITEHNQREPFLDLEGDVEDEFKFNGYAKILEIIENTLRFARRENKQIHEDTITLTYHTDWLTDEGYHYSAYARYMGLTIIEEVRREEKLSKHP